MNSRKKLGAMSLCYLKNASEYWKKRKADNRMKQKAIPLFVFIILLTIGAGVLYSNSMFVKKETKKQTIELPKGAQTYLIQSAKASTNIYEATINPLDVKVGDTQTMVVKAKAVEYPIESVVANVETDTGIKTYNLELSTGNSSDGIWEGEWVVHDTHSKTYRTTFVATNTNKEIQEVTLTWTDPCTPAPGGNWTLDSNCSFTGVSGVDNGNVIINNASRTMTIEAGATFVWNHGKEIQISAGTTAINSTGKLKQDYLCMTDADGDGYPPSLTQSVCSTATPTAPTVRRNILATITTVDCNDGNATYTSSCVTDGDGDGVTDASDCASSDSTKWQFLIGYTNSDGDGYGVGSSQSVCSGSALPMGYASVGGDCYDTSADAYPGSGYTSVSPRGDGSYDWNCNGVVDKYLDNVTSLSPNTCYGGNYANLGYLISPTPACGSSATAIINVSLYSDAFCVDSMMSCGPGPCGTEGALSYRTGSNTSYTQPCN